ncbi:aminotransferase class I/II-fold pyridoxal phosphate-dependent enzyme [Xenophilus sp. Marseille-Q4582]|uniref:aminotransferase class I/II-fold pyridoxal phosphate-dependent enzyme n=1 Tax=Xenophilus sp. Marseille-Q4582 TaxID=2866600 RepID=UPI001CE40D47|nr:aminotransferase class I/II-fold pyridoxal phosphate-dependent enzyme [Xenophilus sp. Marseille-Q4582]
MTGSPLPVHGGPDAQGVPLHDFSTNANACGPCPHAVAALRAADPARYPDPAYTALREQLAAFHGVARDRIVLAGSASEFIARITAAVAFGARGQPGAVQVPRHAYGDYARAAQAWGLAVRAEEAAEGAVDGAMAAEPPLLAWACDPSAPLGRPHAGLAAKVDALAPGVPMVLDRAYEPLRLTGALALAPAQLDRVWQLWSPNKALGLTGVRGAYAIAPAGDAQAGLLRRLSHLAPSWPLGAHAVAMLQSWAGAAAQAWLAHSLPTLRAWKAEQMRMCAGFGWCVLDSDANYFCADWRAAPGLADAAAALQALRRQGLKLRDAGSFGLPGHVRLGVRGPHSQAALLAAWASIRSRHP